MAMVWGLRAGMLATIAGLTAAALADPASAGGPCCRVPAGTVVKVELVAPVSTEKKKSGDPISLRLAAPLIVDGQIMLRRGAPGVGEVLEAARPGMGGKGAKLVLAARYLQQGRTRVMLRGLQMTAVGHDNSTVATAAGIGGIAFAPLGVVGLAIHGGDVVLPAGSSAIAKVASDVTLRSLGRASRAQIRAALAQAVPAPPAQGGIDIPPPPAGSGQVIFFRPMSLMGTGQWFNVRENGKALGKLTNGAFFIQVVEPGPHTYTDSLEPEFKDKLKLDVAPGETYYVAGALTHGVVLGAAELTPSDRAAFNKAADSLKPAAPLDAGSAPPPSPSASGSDSSAAAPAVPGRAPATSLSSAPTPTAPGSSK